MGGEDLVSAEVSTANGNGMPAGCLLPPPSPTRPSTIKPTLPPSPVKSNLKFELSSMYDLADEIKCSIEQTLSSKEQVDKDVENLTRAFKALSEGQTRFRSHIQKSLDSIKEMVGHLAQMKNQQGKHVSTISAGGDHISINPRRLADMNKSPILKKFVDPSIDSIVDHDHEGNMFIDINDSYLRKAIDIQEKDDGVVTMATDYKLDELAADFFSGYRGYPPDLSARTKIAIPKECLEEFANRTAHIHGCSPIFLGSSEKANTNPDVRASFQGQKNTLTIMKLLSGAFVLVYNKGMWPTLDQDNNINLQSKLPHDVNAVLQKVHPTEQLFVIVYDTTMDEDHPLRCYIPEEPVVGEPFAREGLECVIRVGAKIVYVGLDNDCKPVIFADFEKMAERDSQFHCDEGSYDKHFTTSEKLKAIEQWEVWAFGSPKDTSKPSLLRKVAELDRLFNTVLLDFATDKIDDFFLNYCTQDDHNCDQDHMSLISDNLNKGRTLDKIHGRQISLIKMLHEQRHLALQLSQEVCHDVQWLHAFGFSDGERLVSILATNHVDGVTKVVTRMDTLRVFPMSKLPLYLPCEDAESSSRDEQIIITEDISAQTSEFILEQFIGYSQEVQSDNETAMDDAIVDRVRDVHTDLFDPQKMRTMVDADCLWILTNGVNDRHTQRILYKGHTDVFRFIKKCRSTPHTIDLSHLAYASFELVERVIDHMRFLRLYKLGLVGSAPDKSVLFPPDDSDFGYTTKELTDFLDFFGIDLDVY